MTFKSLRGRLLVSLVLGALVVAALMAYADFSQMLSTLVRFRWELIPAIVGPTLFNYLLRFVKWEFYLRQIGVEELPTGDSFAIFFSGLSMVVTPAKVGEWLKCYLLWEASGTPFGRSAPIVIAERLSDGLALVLLASGGLFLSGLGWQIMALTLVLAGGIVIVFRYQALTQAMLSAAERVPLVSSQVHQLRQFYQSSHILFSPRNLAIAVGLGFISWLGECLAFFFVLVGLGLAGSWLLAIQAAFILCVSTLGASVFLLPGGLGVVEGSLTALSQVLLGLPKEAAAVAALLIRLCTLWFGVSLGTLMLLFATRRLRPRWAAAKAEA